MVNFIFVILSVTIVATLAVNQQFDDDVKWVKENISKLFSRISGQKVEQVPPDNKNLIIIQSDNVKLETPVPVAQVNTPATVKISAVKPSTPVQSSCVSVSANANCQVADGVRLGIDDVKLNVKYLHNGDFSFGFKHLIKFVPTDNSLHFGDETLFVHRSISVGDTGKANIDAKLDTKSRVLSVGAEWVSKQRGLSVSVDANTKDQLKEVEVKGSKAFCGIDVGFDVAYDVHGNSANIDGSIARDDTTVNVGYNTGSKTTEVSVKHSFDASNSITPSVNLKTGKVNVVWNRKLHAGSLESKLSIPEPSNAFSLADKSLSLNWKADSAHGGWRTKADIPLSNFQKSKLSVSRDFSV